MENIWALLGVLGLGTGRSILRIQVDAFGTTVLNSTVCGGRFGSDSKRNKLFTKGALA